jgi:hemerythrin-like domain-containing protein
MNAIELLTRQHEHACALYDQYRQTDDEAEKHALFEVLADNLAAHTIIEERLFFPGVFAGKRLEQLNADHRALKRELVELIADGSSGDFDQRLEQLFDLIARHIEQEEQEVLPLAAKQLSGEEMEQLGERMECLFDQVMNQSASDASVIAAGREPLPLQ